MKKLKYKLVSLLIMTSVIPLLTLGIITVVLLNQMGLNEARHRLESNLDIGVSIYQNQVDNLKFIIRDVNRRVSALMEEDQIDLLRNEFVNFCRKSGLDFFEVTDAGGNVLVSISDPENEGKDISTDKFVKRALRFQTSVSTEIMEEKELVRLGLDATAQLTGSGGRRALVLKATTPVINRNEIIIGTIQAGYILNNNTSIIVDEIRKRTGLEASVFLGQTRIATTLRSSKGFVPVGEVFTDRKNRVLITGQRFLTRISSGGTRYRAGYTALYDSNSAVIGMLGVAIPEKQIFGLRDQLIGFFAFTVLAAIGLSFSFGMVKGSRIVASVKKLRKGIEAFGRGNLMHRVDISSRDEFEELADFFNMTMVELQTSKRQLEDYSVNIYQLENTVNQSREQLHEAQKKLVSFERMAAMGRMATALSHELRNTFAEINSGIYTLKQKLAGSGRNDVLAIVETLNHSLEHANKILGSVLNFSYPKKPILSKVDINYLVDDLLTMPVMREMFKKYNIRVEKSSSGNIPEIVADGLQVREMFSNIIVNAVQAMSGGGKLSVYLENDQGMIRVKLSDTGPGMPEETLKELFTPFFTTKSRGLGLGLCIAKSVADEHGGQIQVYSKPERGTSFIISLPTVRQGMAV